MNSVHLPRDYMLMTITSSKPQIREQILVPDLYVLTVESVAYKKRLKCEEKKNPKKHFKNI